MTAKDGKDGAGRRGIRSPADLPRIRKERERVARSYRKWTFDVVIGALRKSGLLAEKGFVERVGVVNGLCVAAATVAKACGASKDEYVRIAGELYDSVDQVSRDGGPAPAASPESARPSDAPSGLPSRPGPETR